MVSWQLFASVIISNISEGIVKYFIEETELKSRNETKNGFLNYRVR